MKKVIGMAKLNQKNYKKLSVNSTINMVVSTVLFLLIVSFGISTTRLFENYNDQNLSLREITIATTPNQFNDNELMAMRLIPNVSDLNVWYPLRPTENLLIQVDSQELRIAYLDGAHTSHSTFSTRFIKERNSNNLIDDIIVGRDFNNFDQRSVIIDENFVYLLGYFEVEEILGKRISIQLGNVKVDDLLIVGVHDWSLGSLSRQLNDLNESERIMYLNQLHVQPLVVSHDIIDYFIQNSNAIREGLAGQQRVTIFTNTVNDVAQVYQDLLSITDNWVNSELAAVETWLTRLNDLRVFVITISIVILIVSLVSIINVLIIKISTQKKITTLMQKLGFSKRDITNIYVVENFMIFVKAMLIAIIISFIISLGIDMFLASSYSQISNVNRFLFILNFNLTLIFIIILASIVTLISYFVTKIQLRGRSKW